MSIDISYHAFNPSKADIGWESFAEDIVVLRKFGLVEKAKRERREEISKQIKEEYKTKYEPILIKKQKEIFKAYENEGLFIPDVNWNQDGAVLINGRFGPYHPSNEEKMDYLLSYGPLYPKGYTKGGGIPPKFMYVEDREEYSALIKEIEQKKLNIKSLVAEDNTPQIKLSQRQESLKQGTDLDYLCYQKTYDEQRLLNDLQWVDLYYGGITAEFPDSAAFFEPVVDVFNLKENTGDGLPYGQFIGDKQKWLDLYNILGKDIIHTHAIAMAKETDWEIEECEVYIKDFFIGMRPLVKFLKDNPDALLMRYIASDVVMEPESANLFMKGRAQIKESKYKNLIPPLL